MKSYYAPQQLCLVGKAWEVRYYLHKLETNATNTKQLLTSVLKNKTDPSYLNRPNPFILVSP